MKKKESIFRKAWRLVKRAFLILFIAQLLYIILLKWMDPPVTITQLQNWISGNGLKRDYVNYNQMSSHVKLAVMASEDQKFPDHGGFDWKSIRKAAEYNSKKPGRSVRGGSTISQQVAKNVFLWQGKSYIRKGLEAYFTKMIEWVWGKERILEVYLNVIEMGKGVFGVEAASREFFNKPAEKLTRKEAAMIAACLPNPKKYCLKPMHRYIMPRSRQILREMNYLDRDPDIRLLVYPQIKAKGKKN